MLSSEDREGIHHFTEGVGILLESKTGYHMLPALLADRFTQRNVVHQLQPFVYSRFQISDRVKFTRNVVGNKRSDPVRIGAKYRTGTADGLSYSIPEALCDRA